MRILALMREARGDELSAAQRAERRFVQGTMNEEVLARFQRGPGVFVAEGDGVLAGFAVTSEPGAVAAGPPKLTVASVTDGGGDGHGRLFLYGPAAVYRRFQGRGVLTMLLVTLGRELRERFDRGVAFVEAENRKSLAVHRHYGMAEAARFQYDGRAYVVFTFDPASLASRTISTSGSSIPSPRQGRRRAGARVSSGSAD